MIELCDVYKKYPGQGDFLFENANCKIRSAEIMVITGPCNSGKSTLLNLIAAREKPTRGKVLIRSLDIHSLAPSELPIFRRQFGETTPQIKLLENKSVFENIALPLLIRELSAKEIKSKTLLMTQLIGLSTKARALCGQLSSFEQKLVRLGRALVTQPPILLCDEPFEGCDEDRSRQLSELLWGARANGSTLVIATRRPDLFLKRPRRQIMISDRKLLEHPVTQYPNAQ